MAQPSRQPPAFVLTTRPAARDRDGTLDTYRPAGDRPHPAILFVVAHLTASG